MNSASQQSAQIGVAGSLSALNLNRVWVIMRDNGCEGLSEPIAAYRDRLSADRAMSLLAATYVTVKCVEIEVW